MRHILMFFVILCLCTDVQAQEVRGQVLADGEPILFATVSVDDLAVVTETDAEGKFVLPGLSIGEHVLSVSYLGYETYDQVIELATDQILSIEINLAAAPMLFDEVVVTGTKTFKRQTKSAVIVNVTDHQTMEMVQACNLSEGLRFQPGLRIETNCQTCNYTQLRMNGLAGGYAQILINGRPIFSPLTGLYGLEQLPVSMIDRIEVIRGGGSSLYGTSAIGGTVNVLTRIPKRTEYGAGTSMHLIGGEAVDVQTVANASLVSRGGDLGASIYLNHRDRQIYDHNGDNFSELPALTNASAGTSLFWLPSQQQKLEATLAYMHEQRYGGEIVDVPVNLAQQAEDRTHHVYMGSLDYQINSKDERGTLIAYAALQHTDRDHFTGILPDDESAKQAYLANPPYGTSLNTTYQGGVQYDRALDASSASAHVLTGGIEYLVDDIYDEIPAYDYLIDQKTRNLGVFAQSDWQLTPRLNLLTGLRADWHNLVNGIVWSPRLSALYQYGDYTQIRASAGTGFRAPQAFDADLHIAFAGGGISRVQLAPDLSPERSQSYSISINYDRPTAKWVAGYTLEGFYTVLDRAFVLQPIGEDAFGEVFEKRNAQSATVRGITAEARLNYDRKVQLEAGWTLQRSNFSEEISYFDELPALSRFVRTPDLYGFANLSLTPSPRWSANINYVHTGSMIVPHFGGAPGQPVDTLVDSQHFHDVSIKVSYHITHDAHRYELYLGVKNVLDSYQPVFDIGKDRDSNFVYGPGQPRTPFLGVKFGLE